MEYSNQLDLHAPDSSGNTALHLACEEGSVEAVRRLCAAGADPWAQNKEEKTPIELAKDQFLEPMSKIMLEADRGNHGDRIMA